MELIQIIIAILTIVASFATAKLTVANERKTLVLTVKRNLYMDVYKHIYKLNKNPTLIYEQDFMDALYDLSIQIDVYASKSVKRVFVDFYNDCNSKYTGFIVKFREESEYETRQALAKENPLFSNQFKREEDDYKIQNLCNIELLEELVSIIKKELVSEK